MKILPFPSPVFLNLEFTSTTIWILKAYLFWSTCLEAVYVRIIIINLLLLRKRNSKWIGCWMLDSGSWTFWSSYTAAEAAVGILDSNGKWFLIRVVALALRENNEELVDKRKMGLTDMFVSLILHLYLFSIHTIFLVFHTGR